MLGSGERVPPANVPSAVATTRIIVAAMALGVSFFAAVILFQNPPTNLAARFGTGNVLTWVGIGGTPVVLLLATLIPAATVVAGRKKLAKSPLTTSGTRDHAQSHAGDKAQSDDPELLQLFVTRLNLACGMIEGVGFLNGIAYMIEGDPISLMALALVIVVIAAKIPTQQGVERWLEDQRRRLAEDRSLAPR